MKRLRPALLKLLIIIFIWICLSSCAGYVRADDISVHAAVEKKEVFVGESFVLQIQVDGNDAPDKPDMSVIKDFSVESAGGRQNNSSQITIINGRMTKRETHGYIFHYRLTPRKAGRLTIPPITVHAGGGTVSTASVNIQARQPAETKDFKLRFELSDTECYTGQPVTLTVTWYIGKDVSDYNFTIPVLSDDRFYAADTDVQVDQAKKDAYVRINLGRSKVIARKGRGTLDGREYLTVSFRKILIPMHAGSIRIPKGTVACSAVTGYSKKDSRDPFDDFFFGTRRRAVTKNFVAPSNSPVLHVKELPREGRPDDFSGLVGKYSIIASAKPADVYVGDPITLTIGVTGPDYLENVEMPALGLQRELARDFKIPSERAAGKIDGGVKTFTQTIRAKHAGVTRIPRISLPYFDAEEGKYAAAYTDPIPLDVKGTRVVTADDAEGVQKTEISKNELEVWSKGIAANYEDLSVLEDQTHGVTVLLNSPLWWMMLGLPPLVYVFLLAGSAVYRRRRADPALMEARRAYGECVRSIRNLKTVSSEEQNGVYVSALEALRKYLGRKLRMPYASLTYRDVEGPLLQNGVTGDEREALKNIFEKCEAGGYAGIAAHGEIDSLCEEMIELVRKIERKLK